MLRWRWCWAVVALTFITLASCLGQKSERPGPAAAPYKEDKRANNTALLNSTAPAKNVTNSSATSASNSSQAQPPAVASGTSACPASMLPYLEQQQGQQQPAPEAANQTNFNTTGIDSSSGSRKELSGSQQQPSRLDKLRQQPPVPPWPPTAIRDGLTCTMEISHVAAAMPGSADVCNVILIKNNLLSVLYSWQLMWEMSGEPGLEAVAADGDVLITSSGAGTGGIVRVVNGAQSPSIEAQGGKASFVLQTEIPFSNKTDSSNSTAAAASSQLVINPSMGSVYLNGLQCTRLPLRPLEAGAQQQDCTATRWEVDSNGLFTMPFRADSAVDGYGKVNSSNSSLGSVPYYWRSSDPSDTNSSSGSDNINDSSSTDDDKVAAALRWLSCTSHYCCGLQVVPPGTESSQQPAGEPAIGAMDGPADGTASAANTSAAMGVNASTGPNSSTQVTAATLTTADLDNTNSTSLQPQQLLQTPDQQPQQQSSGPNNITWIAALVASLVGTALVISVVFALVQRKRKSKQRHSQRQRLQQLMQTKDPAASSLATAALIRGSSNASTESSSSQQGGPTSSTAPGSNSLVSMASTASWHHSSSAGRPPVLIRQHPGAGAGGHGAVWRAGSWQGTDTAQYLGSSPPGGQLFRSVSSPQPLLQQQSSDQTTLNIAALEQQPPPLPPPSQPQHRRQSSNPNIITRATSALPSSQPLVTPSHPAETAVDAEALSRSASGAASSQQSTTGAPNSAGNSWGSLRQLFGNSKPPRSSAGSLGSTTTLGRSGSLQIPANSAAISNASTVPYQGDQMTQAPQQQMQIVQYQRPQLQLIQETAPLAPAQLQVPLSIPASLRRHASGPISSFAAGTASAAGASVSDAGQQAQNPAANSAAVMRHDLAPLAGLVSRRISPIVSIFEDASSATSNESIAAAPWHHADRQLLEEQPGWLNIDFAQEVRLERKLGEGGFGQVFKARWKDDVIAVKLVPFMSVVTHHNLSVSLVSAAEAGPEQAGSGAAGPAAPQPPAAADLMGVGMQFSAASLRAIKMEIRVLSQLSHKNIVAFKGACLAPPHICILEELAEGGSLHARLYSRSSCRKLLGLAGAAGQPLGRSSSCGAAKADANSSKQPPADGANPPNSGTAVNSKPGRTSSGRNQLPPPMSIGEVLRVAVDVASAMQYLHALKPQVVHRDLKPQNVLLDLHGRAKVCDFGISKMKDASLAASSTRLQAGTPAFMAPEQFEGRPVTDKVDVFAFGVMLWECFEQQQPWKDLTPMQIIYAVGLQKERLNRPASCPDDLWQLIEACWHQQPDMRPSFDEILPTLSHMQQQVNKPMTHQQACDIQLGMASKQAHLMTAEEEYADVTQAVDASQAADTLEYDSAVGHAHGTLESQSSEVGSMVDCEASSLESELGRADASATVSC